MVQTLTLKAEARNIKGKKVKKLREKGYLPVVLYGHGISSLSLKVLYNDFEKIYDQVGGSTLISLDVSGKRHNVLIYQVVTEPVSQRYFHADFYQVKMTEKITAEVPLHFIGESLAVEEQDGVLVKNMDVLEVSCLPADLPPHIKIDISALKKIDDVIHISDLKIPEGVEVLKEKEEVVVTVTPPRTEEELAELEEEVAEEEEVEKVEAEAEKKEGGEKEEIKGEEKKEEVRGEKREEEREDKSNK
jgi:large subunit ribosomal protein L25